MFGFGKKKVTTAEDALAEASKTLSAGLATLRLAKEKAAGERSLSSLRVVELKGEIEELQEDISVEQERITELVTLEGDIDRRAKAVEALLA